MLDYWKVIDFSCEICENTSFAVAPFLEMGTYIRSCWKTYSPWRWFYLHNLQNVGWTSPFWRGVNLPQKTNMDTQNYDFGRGDSFSIYGHVWYLCYTVDGQNPAPPRMITIPLFIGFYPSQVVVWDFVHRQYLWGVFFVNTVLSSMESSREYPSCCWGFWMICGRFLRERWRCSTPRFQEEKYTHQMCPFPKDPGMS